MFSICVPVYNVEEYLDECVASLLQQSERDFEIVLVDDGSTDSSGRICDGYASRFPAAVRVIHQENRGLFHARGTAFSAASGRYLLCVDSDDTLREDALEKLKGAIEFTGAQVVFFDWSRQRDFARDWAGLEFCRNGELVTITQHNVLKMLFSSRKVNNMCLHVVAADCIDPSVAERLGIDLQYGEDLFWNLSVYPSATLYAYFAEPLYYYRPNQSSISNTYSETRARDISMVRAALRDFATNYCRDCELEEVLTDISSVDLMQVVDLIQMVCLSGSEDWRVSLENLRRGHLFLDAWSKKALCRVVRPDYRLQLRLFEWRFYLLLRVIVRAYFSILPLLNSLASFQAHHFPAKERIYHNI